MGEARPDCGAPFTGQVVERERLVEDIEPVRPTADNNEAERALRPAVVTRKTSFGSRSKRGAQNFARLLSLIQTWEQQSRDFFATGGDMMVVYRTVWAGR